MEQKLAALGCDPIVGMARIAMDDKNPVELRSAGFLTRIETLTARPLRARKRGPKPA